MNKVSVRWVSRC